MADWDRMKASLFALIKAALPRIDYYALYYGKVVAWNKEDQTVDVRPNDSRVPSISGVTMRSPAGTASRSRSLAAEVGMNGALRMAICRITSAVM